MGWTTLYITGKGDFRKEVSERLEDSKLKTMPGYPGTFGGGDEVHDLYWIDEKVSMRSVKEAVGSKLIWRYRLTFYPSLEAFIESQNTKQNKADSGNEDFGLLEEFKAAVR